MRSKYVLWGLRIAGAGLLAASAAIHLDLYLTGYRSIPTIGWLFLLQVIAAFGLALAVLIVPLIPASWLPASVPGAAVDAGAAAGGAAFALSTLGGYLLSLWVGLFGFKEVRTTAGTVAGILEIAAFAALATLAALLAAGVLPAPWVERVRRAAAPGVVVVSVAALAVLGGSVAAASGTPAGPATAGGKALLSTTTIGGVSVLTNSTGRTLYWFAPDTPARSACYGTCAAYWPPVYGLPAAADPGVVTAKLGTIRRTDGTLQATYGGHPLYTYIGDTAPGQASGNNINLNGGFWHVVPAGT
jgi:predicted lipoprotein with Yx(FWY)xxD motif